MAGGTSPGLLLLCMAVNGFGLSVLQWPGVKGSRNWCQNQALLAYPSTKFSFLIYPAPGGSSGLRRFSFSSFTSLASCARLARPPQEPPTQGGALTKPTDRSAANTPGLPFWSWWLLKAG